MLNKEKYYLALGVLQQQFNLLSQEYAKLVENNPIEHFKYRLKSDQSIEGKLLRLKAKALNHGIDPGTDYDCTDINVENKIDDILGIRVVCPFINDVYKVREQIKKCFNVQVVEERDYIKNPKQNGYSSYHMKVLVPIQLPNTNKKELVKAEIQIRTITMDVAASLEHKIFYKKNVTLLPEMQETVSKIFYYCNALDRHLEEVLKREKSNKKIKKYNLYPTFMKSEEYMNFMTVHQTALLEIKNALETISVSDLEGMEMMPISIEHIKCRMKSNDRVLEKLKRQNKKFSFENVKDCIRDLAGIRIVCPFLDDVEEFIKRIRAVSELEDSKLKIIEEQDFIHCPKENGYASYHMIVSVPIATANGIEQVKVEIQLRTMAQEMWAVTEEKLCYQKKVTNPTRTSEELKKLADYLRDFDDNMNKIIQYSREQQQGRDGKKKILSKNS